MIETAALRSRPLYDDGHADKPDLDPLCHERRVAGYVLPHRERFDMTWHPINKDNALDSVVWGVVLSEPLVQRHQSQIQANDGEIREVLPDQTRSAFFGFEVNRETGRASLVEGIDQHHPAGMVYAKSPQDGAWAWRLDISGETVGVINRAYENWEKTSPVAFDLMTRLSASLAGLADDIPVRHVELVYKDVFWWADDADAVDWHGLFADGAKHIPNWVFSTSSLWHSDMGEIIQRERWHFVERMAIRAQSGSVDNQPRMLAVMDTTVRCLGEGLDQLWPVGIGDVFATDNASFDARRCFDVMHGSAKSMFVEVLSSKMRRRLGVSDV